MRPIAYGILLECAYVLTIGGDFMSGRLFAAPLLVSVVVLARLGTAQLNGRWPLAFVAVIGLGLSAKYPSFTSDATYGLNRTDALDRSGVSDERAYYYQTSGLLTASRDKALPDSHWTKAGWQFREQLQGQPPKVVVDQHAGFYGFTAGPGLHIIDPYALGEPLLARLPCETPWRIGHFKRTVPDGYLETVQSGENQIKDVSLRIYYDKMALIVRAPLFSPHRLSTILKMNLGEYDGLIRAYLTTSRAK
jgi:arabinofuranosyltransferase